MGIRGPRAIKNDILYSTGVSDSHSMDAVRRLLVQEQTKMESLLLLACDVLAPKEVCQLPQNENLTPLCNKECHSLSHGGLRFPFHWCCNTTFGTKRTKMELQQQWKWRHALRNKARETDEGRTPDRSLYYCVIYSHLELDHASKSAKKIAWWITMMWLWPVRGHHTPVQQMQLDNWRFLQG